MATYQRGETYYKWITFRNRAKELTDPDTTTITIINPCGSVVTDAQTMSSDDTGIFYYGYDIPADAVYGEWDIKVIATLDGDVSTFKSKLYILPWDIVDQTRVLSGITSKKSVSDNDISAIIWEAYSEALRDVYIFWEDDFPKCNPDTGAWLDGINTTFATKNGKLADSNGDGVVTGYGEQSCGTDVDGWWKDTDGDCHQLKITVLDARCGKLTITQWDDTPLPATAKLVYVNYYTEWRTFNKAIFKSAVAFLAAHKCIMRFKALDKATQADLHSSKTVILDDRNRMERAYKKAMRKISKPIIGAGMLPGE